MLKCQLGCVNRKRWNLRVIWFSLPSPTVPVKLSVFALHLSSSSRSAACPALGQSACSALIHSAAERGGGLSPLSAASLSAFLVVSSSRLSVSVSASARLRRVIDGTEADAARATLKIKWLAVTAERGKRAGARRK